MKLSILLLFAPVAMANLRHGGQQGGGETMEPTGDLELRGEAWTMEPTSDPELDKSETKGDDYIPSPERGDETMILRGDGACGNGKPGNLVCADPGQCCSQWGYCGTDPHHCDHLATSGDDVEVSTRGFWCRLPFLGPCDSDSKDSDSSDEKDTTTEETDSGDEETGNVTSTNATTAGNGTSTDATTAANGTSTDAATDAATAGNGTSTNATDATEVAVTARSFNDYEESQHDIENNLAGAFQPVGTRGDKSSEAVLLRDAPIMAYP